MPRRFAVVSAGKAAWRMTAAFVEARGAQVTRALIAGPNPTGAPDIPGPVEWFDAGHPYPNDASIAAARRALEIAHEVGRSDDEWLVVLLSGGASAMLSAPAAGITVAEKIATARALMRAGVAIDGLNCVRKHLSDIKGGALAAEATRTVTLAISDVHGPIADDPSVIGSGPTVADPTTFAAALAIVKGVADIPSSVMDRLERGARGEVPETVKPGDPRLSSSIYVVLGNRKTALDGARAEAESRGYEVATIEEPIDGEAREASRRFLTRAGRLAKTAGRPFCVLAAGETTVTVKGDGLGGRNQEFALAAASALGSAGRAEVLASAGTDGIDGPTDAAGAIVDSTTLERAERAGLDPPAALARNDAYHFFQPLGDLLMWGPTGTNVGDVQVLLIA
jgi:glycerate 2-kinase